MTTIRMKWEGKRISVKDVIKKMEETKANIVEVKTSYMDSCYDDIRIDCVINKMKVLRFFDRNDKGFNEHYRFSKNNESTNN